MALNQKTLEVCFEMYYNNYDRRIVGTGGKTFRSVRLVIVSGRKDVILTMADLSNTQFIDINQSRRMQVSDVIRRVYDALMEKGYNPINQLVGYIMSGDPTYITSYNNARSLVMKVERDEILEELIRTYINTRLRDVG